MIRSLRDHAYFVLSFLCWTGAGLFLNSPKNSKEWVLLGAYTVGIICFYFLVSRIVNKIFEWRYAPIMKELDAAIEEQQRLDQLVREEKISPEEFRKRSALNVQRATDAADKL